MSQETNREVPGMNKFTKQQDSDLADIIWWIKGFQSANENTCPFNDDHIEAIKSARLLLREQWNPKRETEFVDRLSTNTGAQG